MSVIRSRPQKEFVALDNSVLQDQNLSAQALGLWARCMSRPENWEFHISELCASFKMGKYTMYKALRELIKYGYAFRGQKKVCAPEGWLGKKKVFSKIEYIFVGKKLTPEEKKLLEEEYEKTEFKKSFPHADFQHAQTQHAEEQPLQKTDSLKKTDKNTKMPLARPITLNSETKKFEGISEEDLQRWQNTFPAVNVRKELQEALLWALTVSRSNYRKSLNTWMSNVNKAHTTPFRNPEEHLKEVTQKDIQENKKLAEEWEKKYEENPQMNYHLQSSPTKVSFTLPNRQGYEVDYNLPIEEFIKKCLPALKRMRLKV